MKKTTKNFVLIVLAFSISLASCGVSDLNKKAEASANAFFSDLQKKDYDAAINSCSDQAFNSTTKDAWLKAFHSNATLMGDIKSFTKSNNGFNIAAATGKGTTVVEVYDVQWQYGKSRDSVILLKENVDNMKVYGYSWKHTENMYMTEMEASEKSANAYMQAVQSGNYDAATGMCSEEALRITPKSKWEGILSNAKNKLGNINSFSVLKDSSSFHIDATGQLGEGNYYDVVVLSDRNGNSIKEKITFFQKNYDQPLKVTGHSFL